MSEINTLEDLENAPAESIVTEPTAEQREIEFLKASLNQVAAERDRVGEQNNHLREQLRTAGERHRADITLIGDRLIQEANDRGWCEEYDTIIDSLNRELMVELPLRERDYDVEVAVYLTISVSARNEHAAIEAARDIASKVETYADEQSGCYSRVGDYEVEES